MIQLIRSDLDINFLGARKITGAISAVLVLGAVALFFGVGPKYGIDFAGGIEMQIAVKSSPTIDDVRKAAESSNVGSFEVQSYGDDGTQFLLRVQQPEGSKIEDVVRSVDEALRSALGQDLLVERQEFVGPKAGEELRKKGFMAVFFALLGILGYLAIRFELSYALGAVAALFHDVLLVVGFFIAIGQEFNLQILAALLTIVGYSLNDTIVVFDRIRENVDRRAKSSLERVINKSVNEMLSRTILTSVTTGFTAVTLFVVAAPGSVIKSFALALVAGIVVGTYSSVYVASPIVLALDAAQRN